VHSFALNLGLVLAAEKSKTPFYIAGGILVAWALFVSMGLGRKPDFPSSEGQQRGIMAVSAILVLAAVSMAVVTSGGSKSAKAATATSATTETTASETPATGTAGATTSATTGTPAPASSPAAASTVSLEANKEGQLSYNTKSLSAKAGKVTIEMANMSPVEHNVTIAQGSKVLGATPTFTGGKKSVTVNLAPGTYTFYCSVPGHRQAGMEGTLTVSS
jgi:plastocyanin